MTSAATGAPIRLLLAVGDRGLERRLLQALPEFGLVIAARCLDASTLHEELRAPGVDVVLVSDDLHGFSPQTLAALHDRRRPVLVLTSGQHPDQFDGAALRLPAASSPAAIADAIVDAEARGPIRRQDSASAISRESTDARGPVATSLDGEAERGRVLVVTSGKGAPGKTTVAIAIAAGLGATGEQVVLVDADRRGGNVAPMLDLDPRRGLVGLLSGEMPSGTVLSAELQPGPHCVVLAGIERPELAVAVGDDTVPAAVSALRQRFEWVVVDATDLGTRPDDPVLRVADEVLLVLGADLIAIWNARLVQPLLRASAGGAPVSAVVNRREGREHYNQDEIEAALGMEVIVVVREDRDAARRAIADQVPLSATGGRAARDLRQLVEQLRARRASPVPEAAVPGRQLAWEG
ncbi:MAG: hypothetical protein AMXMBFR23_02860 [Chloroflexota bacterium]